MPKVKLYSESGSVTLASYGDFFKAIEIGQVEVIDALYFTDAHLTVRNLPVLLQFILPYFNGMKRLHAGCYYKALILI